MTGHAGVGSTTDDPSVDRWSVAALGALTAVLTAVAGPAGALSGMATALVWYTLGTPYALVAGHVALLALFPDGIGPAAYAPVGVAFAAVMIAPANRSSSPVRFAAVAIASVLLLGGVVRLLLPSLSLWLIGVVLIAPIAFVGYGLHRYGRLLTRPGSAETNRAPTDSRPSETNS